MKQIVLAVTGASGIAYAQRMTQCLVRSAVHLHLVFSARAREVIADETDISPFSLAAWLGRPPPTNITLYSHRNINARIASGSFLTHGMVICPCSSHTLAAVAGGLGDNLVTRAAMVTLKEARRLIIVPREMPLSQLELENMLRLSRAGAIVCPACPGFYMRPRSVDDLVDFVVGRVLDLLDVPHDLRTRWSPRAAPAEPPNGEEA